MRKSLIISLLLTIMPFAILQAHGLHIDIKIQNPVVIATIGYSETQPLADGVVTIFSPADGVKAYQTGKSDKAGNFVFLPDTGGEWTITVDDQKGHAEKEVITIPAGFFIPGSAMQAAAEQAHVHEHEHEAGEMPLTLKIIIGLSLIFGITGFFYGYQARRSGNK
jgi:hypothetical protein